MDEINQNDPLLEWNHLNIENTKHSFVSALYQSMTETTVIVEKASLWLLAGTGATGAFLISQIHSVLPYLSKQGFQTCMLLLTLSAIFGFLAKYFSLRCEIQIKVQSTMTELAKPILEKFEEDEDKIKNHAKIRGLKLETEMNITAVMIEFARPFPLLMRWLITRKVNKTKDDRQAGFHDAVKTYVSQLRWTFFQYFLFLLFLLAGAWFANPGNINPPAQTPLPLQHAWSSETGQQAARL